MTHRPRQRVLRRSQPGGSLPSSSNSGRSRTQKRMARSSCPTGERIGVTNLAKVFWPKLKLTKGDLLRYYAAVSPLILPAVADRPLVMKRFPNGIDKPAFYQQRSRIEQPPPGVRIEILAARRRTDLRAERAPLRRRQLDHAPLHDTDRGDLAGSVVLARAVAARRRLRGARPRSRR